jgi:hypothetical protein
LPYYNKDRTRRSSYLGVNMNSLMLVGLSGFTALFLGIVIGLAGGVIALLMIVFFVFIGFSIYDYRAGVLIAVVMLPLTATSLIPHEMLGITGLNPLNAVLVMVVGSLVMTKAFSRTKVTLPTIPRAFWAYLGAIMFAGAFGSIHVSSIPSYYDALGVIKFNTPVGYLRDILLKPMIILATAYLLAIAVANARRSHLYLLPFFLSAIILPIVVIVYIAISGVSLSVLASSHSRGFLSKLGTHANELGFMFNMGFAMMVFCFFTAKRPLTKLVLAGLAGITVLAIGLTFSRGAFLGFVVVLAYFLFTQRQIRMMIAVLVMVAFGSLLVPKAIVERASTGVASGKVEDISAGRVGDIWLPLLPEILTSPVVGHGLSSVLWSQAARHRTILPVGHPHSAYLGLFLDFGIVGAIIIAFFFRHMWRLFREISETHPEPLWQGFFMGARASILLVLVQGVTDDRFTPTLPQTFLWLAYGLAVGLLAWLKKAQVESPIPTPTLTRIQKTMSLTAEERLKAQLKAAPKQGFTAQDRLRSIRKNIPKS